MAIILTPTIFALKLTPFVNHSIILITLAHPAIWDSH